MSTNSRLPRTNLPFRIFLVFILFFNLASSLVPAYAASVNWSGSASAANQSQPAKPENGSQSNANSTGNTGQAAAATPKTSKKGKSAVYASLPYSFEANSGQADSPVKFLARGYVNRRLNVVLPAIW